MSLLSFLFDEENFQDVDFDGISESAPDVDVDLASVAGDPSQTVLVAGRPSLETQVGQLNLVVEALIRVIVSQGIAKPKDLTALMQEIDVEDGEPDGEFHAFRSAVPKSCPDCDARIPKDKTYCVFCGRQFATKGTDLLHRIDEFGRPRNRNFPPEFCPACDASVPDGQPYCQSCGEQFAVPVLSNL